MAVVQVESLGDGRAPIVPDGDDIVGDVFVIEDLGQRVGLLQIVVLRWISGLRRAGKPENVWDDHGIGMFEHVRDGAGPHVSIIWESMEEKQNWR